MMIQRITGCTRVLGQTQGYLGLPIKDAITESGHAIMLSAWEPTPDEIALINQGGKIILTVLGTAHAPVMLHVEVSQ